MKYELTMKQGIEEVKYPYETLDECCKHILNTTRIGLSMGWKLEFKIFILASNGDREELELPMICMGYYATQFAKIQAKQD